MTNTSLKDIVDGFKRDRCFIYSWIERSICYLYIVLSYLTNKHKYKSPDYVTISYKLKYGYPCRYSYIMCIQFPSTIDDNIIKRILFDNLDNYNIIFGYDNNFENGSKIELNVRRRLYDESYCEVKRD